MERLPGEAHEGLYGFEDAEGNRVQGREGIVPVLELVDGQEWRFIGTAFFIAENGIFVTAKHVVEAEWTRGRCLFICQFIGVNECFDRPIAHLSWHETADLAVGILTPAAHAVTGEPLINTSLRLTTVAPQVGEYVATYAYPKTVIEQTESAQRRFFGAGFYDGYIEEYFPNGHSLLRGPCYRTSMIIHGGASGGPVGGPSGQTFAVNSTGFDGNEISHISRIDEVLSLAISLNDGGVVRDVTVTELAQDGAVAFDPPLQEGR